MIARLIEYSGRCCLVNYLTFDCNECDERGRKRRREGVVCAHIYILRQRLLSNLSPASCLCLAHLCQTSRMSLPYLSPASYLPWYTRCVELECVSVTKESKTLANKSRGGVAARGVGGAVYLPGDTSPFHCKNLLRSASVTVRGRVCVPVWSHVCRAILRPRV